MHRGGTNIARNGDRDTGASHAWIGVLFGMACLAFAAGCTTCSPPRKGERVSCQRTNEMVHTNISLALADVDYATAPPSLLVTAAGTNCTTWQEVSDYKVERVQRRRTLGDVTFPRLTGMQACRGIGLFPIWSRTGAFWLTDHMGMRLTRALLDSDKHLFGKLWTSDGELESYVFPLTLSGEWGASIPGLLAEIGLPFSLVGAAMGNKDAMAYSINCLKDPVVLALSPPIDCVIYAVDLPPTLVAIPGDVAKDTVVLAADSALMAGAFAVDVAKTPLTLTYDGIAATADLFALRSYETVLDTGAVLSETGPPQTQEDPPAFGAFDVVVSLPDASWSARQPLDDAGTARISIVDLADRLSRTTNATLTLTLEQHAVARDSRTVSVDAARLSEAVFGRTRRR